MLRVLVTGSREWTNYRVMRDALVAVCEEYDDVYLILGDARGADAMAAVVARREGWSYEVHRADWRRFGRSAGPRRNGEMVAAGPDVAVAFPIGASRGTRDCMRQCDRAGVRVIDGTLEEGAK